MRADAGGKMSAICRRFQRSQGWIAPREKMRLVGTDGFPVSTIPSPPDKTPIRAIAWLAFAAFAAQSMVRVTDSLLPQIAVDFGTTVGAASIVVTAYAVTHGSIQLIIGPVGDRFGKYRSIAVACGMTAALVTICGLAQSLPTLAVARLCSGAAAGWIIPLAMAFIGDVTPYERRQQVLGAYLSGQISGQLFGQAAGGVLGDLFGWRNVFFLLAGLLALATIALVRELMVNPVTREQAKPSGSPRGFAAEYSAVLSDRWARIVIAAVAIEGALIWGTFAYVGADLHLRYGLGFALVGLVVAAFGLGGLAYSLSVRALVGRFGQQGLAINGGVMLAFAYLALIFVPWWLAPIAVGAIGLGFYMLHNTLQTNATQMTPQARGTAVALFSSALYLGQTAGVAVGALVIDRYSAVPLFVGAAILLPALAFWFAFELRQRSRVHPS
jgi:predicted MFS family arabinose efflux permease